MKCPVCKDIDLNIAERQGIEVDYCPRCRGVWLDRGELDKIIDRSAASMEPRPEYREDYRREDERRYQHERDYKSDYHHGKRKKSFLSEIFDFD